MLASSNDQFYKSQLTEEQVGSRAPHVSNKRIASPSATGARAPKQVPAARAMSKRPREDRADVDPMAALEAAALKAIPPRGATHRSSTQSDTPFDFFEDFQRARPVQAAPRCKVAVASPPPSACVPDPALAGPSSSEQSADSGRDSVHSSSAPRAEEAAAEAVQREQHQELDPLARLLVRQNRQVHVRVPRQATAMSDAQEPRVEGRRGQPARFAPHYGMI